MVHRFKDILNPPADLIDSKWDTLRSSLLAEKNNHDVKSECYRDTTLAALCTLYRNKCAICERERGTELQVDHYRPKKKRDNKTSVEYNQPGYYWLAYEWSNLIPLCSYCNINKSTKFPLSTWDETNRISDHINVKGILDFDAYNLIWLQNNERPLLINPEHDINPERHFSFQIDGRIIGRTAEGIETINICKLNRRDVKRERLEIRYTYIREIKSALDDYGRTYDDGELRGELKSVFKRMKQNAHVDSRHSLYQLYLYKYFDYFIVSKIQVDLRGKISKYFKDFNNVI